MAIRLAFGVVYTAVIALLVVPSIYVVAYDVVALLQRIGKLLRIVDATPQDGHTSVTNNGE